MVILECKKLVGFMKISYRSQNFEGIYNFLEVNCLDEWIMVF